MPKRATGRYERTNVGGEEVAAFARAIGVECGDGA